MDGKRGGSGTFADAGKFDGVDIAVVKALAEFDRDGTAGGFDDRFDDAAGKLGIAHERGAIAAFDNFADRTAHVDINDIGAGKLARHRRGLGHDLRLVAEDLDGGGMLVGRHIEKRFRLFVAVTQGLGADHLGDGVGRAFFTAELTKGKVRHARHRGESKGAPDHNSADVYHVRSSPTGQWSEPVTSGRIKASLILSRRRFETRK